MTFDPDHDWRWPEGVSPSTVATMRQKRDSDRAAGRAVQFLHPDSGRRVEFCFSTIAQRDRFVARLSVPYAVSIAQ
jgi:hypothetical protein